MRDFLDYMLECNAKQRKDPKRLFKTLEEYISLEEDNSNREDLIKEMIIEEFDQNREIGDLNDSEKKESVQDEDSNKKNQAEADEFSEDDLTSEQPENEPISETNVKNEGENYYYDLMDDKQADVIKVENLDDQETEQN